MSQPNNTAERDAPNPPTIAFLRDRNGCPGLCQRKPAQAGFL